MKPWLLVLSAFAAALAPALSHACPLVEGHPDFNCDGKINIVVLGDSLVAGYGDTDNNNHGGYVLRAQEKLHGISVENFGVPGLNTVDLLLRLKKAFSGRSNQSLADALYEADLVVLDIGRNDRWFFGVPLQTERRLQKAAAMIRKDVSEKVGEAPLVVTAVLMLPNRGSQGPWVLALNHLIEASDSRERPADLRFDYVSKRLLSSDQIHPTPKGYRALADVFVRYVNKTYPKHVRSLRTDADKDGLYDEFEQSRFHTDPTNPDTDGDGLLDGEDPEPLIP